MLGCMLSTCHQRYELAQTRHKSDINRLLTENEHDLDHFRARAAEDDVSMLLLRAPGFSLHGHIPAAAHCCVFFL